MTDKELKKLSRAELLQMLLVQAKEVERLNQELEKVKSEADRRQIEIRNAGSIAEASLQLSGVFQAAQAAADQYLENVRVMEGQTESYCKQLKDRTERECAQMRSQAEAEARAFWEEIREKIKDPYRDHMWWMQVMGQLGDNLNKQNPGGKHE